MSKNRISGRAIKVRHFRNGTELPWLANDATYQFDYQATRVLPEQVTVLPGDQLTLGKNDPT